MQDKWVLDFKDEFQLPVPSWCLEMTKNVNACESGQEDGAVLLPGFAINW